ncbi:type II CAAX endopeptidase family protein [Paenibacillus sp.]|uniref:type II CAAX endopeptidase family protein n=1 Tax=Paenibacillus sp. TaxID=58172 RepID=UPI002810DF14|nr:type II CAAX endopeptidase family protein [Paenibacillus sp.]
MKNVGNGSKAGMFSIAVMMIASVMGLLKLPGQLYMFAPVLAMLVVLLVTGDLFKRKSWAELGLNKAGFKYWGFALLAPVVVLAAAYLILWSTPYASFFVPEGTTAATWFIIPVKLFVAIVLYTATSSLGEELGWRGYLLPKLAGFGRKKAMALVGLLHGAFHFPIMLAGDYHSAGNPWIVIPMFLTTTVLISFVFGAMRIAAGSVWPAAIMHAVHNIFWATFGEFTQTHSTAAEYLGGESGFVAIALYGLLAVWIMKKEKIK